MPDVSASSDRSAADLERGEPAVYPACPFPLPPAGQLDFLRRQEAAGFRHKDVSFDPIRRKVGGQRAVHPSEERRLADILAQFSDAATAWLSSAYPGYADGLVRDRVTLRTTEEATRAARLTARNDLLHIDNFPTRPTNGRRILRLYVNFNPTEPWVWTTSEAFPELLARFAARHRIPARTPADWAAPAPTVTRLLTRRAGRSAYDAWMLKLHHFLKEDSAFQAQAARKVWSFPPGAMWLMFSDGLAHAQLRGRFALEHSYFLPQDFLAAADESPLSRLSDLGRPALARRAG